MNKWISVKDRLPENRNDVLVIIEVGLMFVVWYEKCESEWKYNGATLHNVTHWIPLPEPPESEDEHEKELEMWSLMS